MSDIMLDIKKMYLYNRLNVIQYERSVKMDRNIVKMKRPASWHGEMWRTALMLGNGFTGILVHGAAAMETIQFNRHDLWHGGYDGDEIPDVSDTFKEMRRKIDEGDYLGVNNNMMAEALRDKGYSSLIQTPCPLGALKMRIDPEFAVSKYERGIDMENGEGYVKYKIGECNFERRFFVSRARDITVIKIKSEEVFTARYRFTVHDNGDGASRNKFEELKPTLCEKIKPNGIEYSAQDFGAVVKFTGDYDSETDKTNPNTLIVRGKEYVILIKAFSHENPENAIIKYGAELDSLPNDYNILLSEHSSIHKELFNKVSIELASDEEHRAFNEDLLDHAYYDKASPALIEKLWRFGRYLFISGTSENGNPFPLYGLWHGGYDSPWSQYVANENVEMSYWHVNAGGLEYSLKSLIKYYYNKIESFRKNARQLFNMNGIFVPAYTTPDVSGASVPVGVIINWISAGGWLSSHFWSYFEYTGDTELLKTEIMPFMIECARFYKDYVTYDENGKCRIYPSVSPENTPANFLPDDFRENMIHACPAVENACMDFAVMKELLSNLISGIELTGMYVDEKEKYIELLKKIPPYMINEDGAVKEWMTPELKDNYYHRHLSHLYPVFPGNEINAQNNPQLMEAFKRAVDLRELGGQSGWSLSHMSNIYARMGEGKKAAECLDLLAKSILNDALITMHNDWRHMGMTIDLGGFAPVQLDANMGAVNAVQEMLFRHMSDTIFILPALDSRFRKVVVKRIVFPHGTVDIDLDDGIVTVSITAKAGFKSKVIMPDNSKYDISLSAGETVSIKSGLQPTQML